MEGETKLLEGCMEKAAEDVPRTATKGKKKGKSKSFKEENPLEQRQAQSARIVDRYPDRIPAIIETAEKSGVLEIVNKKFLLPPDMTVGHLMFMIRKKVGLSAEKAIFVFVADVLPSTSALMCAIYDDHKDEDGFLYFTYSGESTFGGMDLNLPAGNCHSRA